MGRNLEKTKCGGNPVHVALKHTHSWRNLLAFEVEKRTSEGRKCDKD